MKRKLILYIACSIDGYIAGPNDNLDFLNMVAREGEDYGYSQFIKEIDCVILGRKTYDKVLSMGVEFPHADKETYVITRTESPHKGKIRFYTGNLTELVTHLKQQSGKNIFCDGGAEIIQLLMESSLIDELYISLIPTTIGKGIRLFKEHNQQQQWELESVKSFESGLVQIHYHKK